MTGPSSRWRQVFAAALTPLLVIVSLGRPTKGEAQSLRAGSVGVAFNVPEGGGSGLGLRYLWSDDINMGLTFLFDLDYELANDDGEDAPSTWALGFHPDFRFYQGAGSVVPFFELGIGATYAKAPEEDLTSVLGRASIGIGAEWFPAANVGIAGSTGLQMNFDHRTIGEDPGVTEDTLSLDIFRSALTINLYF